MKRRKFKNMSRSNQLFYVFNALFWIVIMFAIVYPLYLVCISSVSDPNAVMRGEVLWKPVDFSWMGYKAVMGYTELWRSYANSLFYTAAHIVISIVVTLTAAYALSVKRYLGRSILSIFFVIPMFFSGGLIPTFLTLKSIGLYDNIWVVILTGVVTVWNLMVARTFIQSNIPEELYEASVLDGASHFQYFFRVVTPLSKTIIAVLSVYYGVAIWNDYMTGLVYLKNRKLLPLQNILREILASLQIDTSSEFLEVMGDELASLVEAMRVAQVAKYCIIVISTLPVVLLYFFLQKHFEKGVMIGSIKG